VEPVRVTTRPHDVFELDQKVFAEIDPSQITVIN
jgi:hypothetical protein